MDAPFPDGLLDDVGAFLEEQKSLPPGRDSYDLLYARPLLFPLQRQREQEKMIQIARSINPKVVCEIGADKGGGIYCWSKCLTTVRRVLACEIRGCPYGQLFERAFPDIEYVWLPFPSRDRAALQMVERATTGRGEPIDVLFIDGDKAFFQQDFDAYLPYMRRDGIVFFHDVADRSPGDAYRRVVEQGYRHEEIADLSEAHEALDREERGIPSASSHEGWLRHWRGASCTVGVIYLS